MKPCEQQVQDNECDHSVFPKKRRARRTHRPEPTPAQVSVCAPKEKVCKRDWCQKPFLDRSARKNMQFCSPYCRLHKISRTRVCIRCHGEFHDGTTRNARRYCDTCKEARTLTFLACDPVSSPEAAKQQLLQIKRKKKAKPTKRRAKARRTHRPSERKQSAARKKCGWCGTRVAEEGSKYCCELHKDQAAIYAAHLSIALNEGVCHRRTR